MHYTRAGLLATSFFLFHSRRKKKKIKKIYQRHYIYIHSVIQCFHVLLFHVEYCCWAKATVYLSILTYTHLSPYIYIHIFILCNYIDIAFDSPLFRHANLYNCFILFNLVNIHVYISTCIYMKIFTHTLSLYYNVQPILEM